MPGSGAGTVSIDTGAVDAFGRALQHHAIELQSRLAAIRHDAARAQLAYEAAGTIALVGEIAGELALTGRMLAAVAAEADAADLFVATDSARLTTELAASLADRVGANPIDLGDPTLASGSGGGIDAHLGHFGFLPVFAPGGPTVDDIQQGRLGDCWLLAALGSAVIEDPQRIVDAITDHGNGTYTVHFADGDITVDDELAYTIDIGQPRLLYASRGAGHGAVLWPAIIEKALAVREGANYGDLDGGSAREAFEAFGATASMMHGLRAALDPDDVEERLVERLDADLPVVAESFGAFGMGGGHAWTVAAVTQSDAGTAVVIRNPWGRLGLSRQDDGTVVYGDGEAVEFARPGDGDLLDLSDPANPELTIPIDVFVANFEMIEIVDGWEIPDE